MSLETVINAGTTSPERATTGLVLMGGGARTAYQVGVLKAIGAMRRLQAAANPVFPFQVLVGTSAGALNAAYLAARASQGVEAFELLARFWLQMHCAAVYTLNVPPWVRFSRILAGLRLWRNAREQGAILDNLPLVDTLHKVVPLAGIEKALAGGAIEALAVTASSYTSGVHWTFCQAADNARHAPWSRPGRRAEFQVLSIEHLAASSAIPFLFPATPLWVDGKPEFFGDGSMRQVSPLSPAVHLGARRLLVIGAAQAQRAGLVGPQAAMPERRVTRTPTLGAIAGHAMASVFHDTLQADVEQAQRVSAALRQAPRNAVEVLPYRALDVLAVQPSQSLDAIAQKHAHELPASVRHALGGLGAFKQGGALASYLLFEPGFVGELIALGEQDAFARKAELMAFLDAGA